MCRNLKIISIFTSLKKNTLTDNTDNAETRSLILRNFELEEPTTQLTDEEMIAYLADAIAYMMESRMDFLMSLLYRLDVSESKIAHAMMPGNPLPANIALAHAVWERQKQRMATKKAFKEQNPNQWDWDME
jgi:hypothetical protein